MHLLHELLRPERVEARDYQLEIARRASRDPVLVVLPTGLGKTVVALQVLLHRLDKDPHTRCLFLAPTKPLVEQHARFLKEALVESVTVAALTGEDAAEDRTSAWTLSRVVCATPQVVHNDVLRGTLDLDRFDLLILDEAHRGVGNYPYVFLAARFKGHRIGLSASPGTDLPGIRAVLANLRLERLEARTESDADVRPYVKEVVTEWVRVAPSPEIVQLARLLRRSLTQTFLELRRLGFLALMRGTPNRKDLLELGHRLRTEAGSGRARSAVYPALSFQARAMKIQHALEMAETQGPGPLAAFLGRLVQEAERAGGSKAARDWIATEEFQQALALSKSAEAPHPKVARVLELVATELAAGARRVLVFANYRETADLLVDRLKALPNVRVERFVGHAKGTSGRGLTKTEQQRIVEAFRTGALNVLVATSVGEEGLDLPETDAVVLFEPVPSGIRMIQRRGRTGRRTDGHLVILMTEGTRDESYYWSSRRRERRMNAEVRFLQRVGPGPLELPATAPAPLPPPGPPAEPVLVDTREFQSTVARHLLDAGVPIKAVALETGDYRIGDHIVIERKSFDDVGASLVDGRFFEQVARLGRAGRSLLLVEGAPNGNPRIGSKAFAGAAAAAYAEHGVGLVFMPNPQASAEFLAALARRAKDMPEHGPLPMRHEKSASEPSALVRQLFEGMPGVGPALSERLREKFPSMARLCDATPAEIESVEGFGQKRAQNVYDSLHLEASSGLEPNAPQGLAVEARDGAAG